MCSKLGFNGLYSYPSYGHWYGVFHQLKITSFTDNFCRDYMGLTDECSVCFVFALYVPLTNVYSFVRPEYTLNGSTLMTKQTTREFKIFLFSLSQMIHIHSYATDTQHLQSTIHYSSKCYIQIFKLKRIYIFPTCCFVASIDMVTWCTSTITLFSTAASISWWGTGKGAVICIISSWTFYKSHLAC